MKAIAPFGLLHCYIATKKSVAGKAAAFFNKNIIAVFDDDACRFATVVLPGKKFYCIKYQLLMRRLFKIKTLIVYPEQMAANQNG